MSYCKSIGSLLIKTNQITEQNKLTGSIFDDKTQYGLEKRNNKLIKLYLY